MSDHVWDKDLGKIGYKILLESPGYIFWKDINSVYRGCNQNGAILYGVNTPEEIIGKTDYDFNQKCAQQFVEQDQYVIQTGKQHISENDIIGTNGDEGIILRTEKKPLYDDKGKIIGVIGHAMDITASKEVEKLRIENTIYENKQKTQTKFKELIDDMMYMINKFQVENLHMQIGQNHHEQSIIAVKNLTHREREILYYLYLHKSPKTIADILSIIYDKRITVATVHSMINKQLYSRFDVYNTEDLIQKAKELKVIPFIL